MKFEVGDHVKLAYDMDIVAHNGDPFFDYDAVVLAVLPDDQSGKEMYVLGGWTFEEYPDKAYEDRFIAVFEEHIKGRGYSVYDALNVGFTKDSPIDFTPVDKANEFTMDPLRESASDIEWDLTKEVEMPTQTRNETRSKEVKPWWFT